MHENNWNNCNGTGCPVEDGTMIDFMCRDGSVIKGMAAVGHGSSWHWGSNHKCERGDIVSWRLSSTPKQVTGLNPITLRDEVRAIDAWFEENAKIIKVKQDARQKIVDHLLAEGFILAEPKADDTTDQVVDMTDQVVDMTDPHNWKVGDLLSQSEYDFKNPITVIVKIEDGKWWTMDKNGLSSYGPYSSMREHFTFHSRPVK